MIFLYDMSEPLGNLRKNRWQGLLHLSYFTTFAYEFSQIKTTEFVITLKRPLVNARSGVDNVLQSGVNLYVDLKGPRE